MNEDRLVALIGRQLFGELTEQEVRELADWSKEAPANRRLLETFADKGPLDKEIDLYRSINPAAAYAKWISCEKTRRRSLIVRTTGWSAAASVLIAVLIIGVTRKTVSNVSLKPVVVLNTSTVLPGKNTAVLTLANGQKVSLDSSVGSDLGVQGNAHLTKLGSGSLAYEASKGVQKEEVYNTLSTPRSGQYQLMLPDGSRVWLNNASSIRYPVAFQGKDRAVELSGEAYFEIAKNVSQPFRVKVNALSVDVLGTSFNIMAYPDEVAIQTTLLTGAVKVKAENVVVQLTPDEQAQWSGRGNIKVFKNVPSQDIVSWKNGFFYFSRASFEEVMRQLARWYDVEVQYEGKVPDLEFGGKIDRDLPLNELLKFLDKNQVHFRLEGRTLVVLPS